MKQVLKERKDVVFYLKMFPIVSIHPDAYDKAKAIVCEREKSNEEALKMLEESYAGKALPKPSCDTKAIDQNIELAERLGIRATPALVFESGRLATGAMKAEQLVKTIDLQARKAGEGKKK
jgi:thiol:disulfide interchange protein DsbC